MHHWQHWSSLPNTLECTHVGECIIRSIWNFSTRQDILHRHRLCVEYEVWFITYENFNIILLQWKILSPCEHWIKIDFFQIVQNSDITRLITFDHLMWERFYSHSIFIFLFSCDFTPFWEAGILQSVEFVCQFFWGRVFVWPVQCSVVHCMWVRGG